MIFVDYYKILGIDKTATPKDIKNAYRKLARKFHPDLNPNDKDAKKNFQQINEANELLSDPEKRRKKVNLTGKGFPVYKSDGKFGDLIITYTIKIPANLTDRQKVLFTELSKL
jgi:DnaJ-class molecular chaperone